MRYLWEKIRFKIPLYTSYFYLRLERKKRRQRHVVQLKLQRNGGNNDFWKLSFCRDTVLFCQKKKKSRNDTEKRGYHPRTKCCYFGHLWIIMILFEYVYKFPEFHYSHKLYWDFRHSCLFPKLQMIESGNRNNQQWLSDDDVVLSAATVRIAFKDNLAPKNMFFRKNYSDHIHPICFGVTSSSCKILTIKITRFRTCFLLLLRPGLSWLEVEVPGQRQLVTVAKKIDWNRFESFTYS